MGKYSYLILGGNFMVVLGIDPGYAIVGYGAIEAFAGKYRDLGHGAIFTYPDKDFASRLEIIYDSMQEMLEKCKPDAISIEKLYFQNNQKTAINVAQARGIVLLAAKKANVPIFEYTPLQVKTVVTGFGQAKKNQVMQMTKRLLNLKEVPKPDDTADALAIAICHANSACAKMRLDLVKRRMESNAI